jgi:Glycosyl transferases group 1
VGTRKVLLITHPVDLGNAAYARNFVAMANLAGDMEHAEFAPGDLSTIRGGAPSVGTLVRRARSAYSLRRKFSRARQEGRVVIIQGLSAALFTAPFRYRLRCFVIIDWTRKLHKPALKRSLTGPGVTFVHRCAMLSVDRLICLTDAVRDHLRDEYHIPQRRLARLRAPYQVDKYRVSNSLGSPLRILFVGGDFYRKGGDVLVNWYVSRHRDDIALTLVTQTDISAPPGVVVLRNNAAAGFADYADFDILALPTRQDSYPVVIGEAAASGLAIATTNKALGAPDIVQPGQNGFIAGSASEFGRQLDELVSSPERVAAYKANSRAKMLAEATLEICWRGIEQIVFGGETGSVPTS